jgi:hypothetical protein
MIRDQEMMQLTRYKQQKMRRELMDESEYLKKIKSEIEADKQAEKDRRLKKADEAAKILEENAR